MCHIIYQMWKYLVTALLVTQIYSAATSPGTVIPVYWGPSQANNQCTQTEWKAIGDSLIAGRTIAIINPNSGPGAAQASEYTVCINYLRTKGVKVIGYVHTKNSHQASDGSWVWDGYRDTTLVTQDIDNWYSWYTVDGIFFDEVSSFWTASFETKSKSLQLTHDFIKYVKTKSATATVVLNPGTYFDAELLTKYDTSVKAVINEFPITSWIPAAGSTCATNAQGETFGPGPFCRVNPNWDGQGKVTVSNPPIGLRDYIEIGQIKPSQLVAILYGWQTITGAALDDYINIAVNKNVGYIYVTDKGSAWASLPSSAMWSDLTQKLSKIA